MHGRTAVLEVKVTQDEPGGRSAHQGQVSQVKKGGGKTVKRQISHRYDSLIFEPKILTILRFSIKKISASKQTKKLKIGAVEAL